MEPCTNCNILQHAIAALSILHLRALPASSTQARFSSYFWERLRSCPVAFSLIMTFNYFSLIFCFNWNIWHSHPLPSTKLIQEFTLLSHKSPMLLASQWDGLGRIIKPVSPVEDSINENYIYGIGNESDMAWNLWKIRPLTVQDVVAWSHEGSWAGAISHRSFVNYHAS